MTLLRRCWRAGLVVLAAAFGLAGQGANAHTRSESLSVWHIDGPAVRATVTLPEAEALRLAEQPGVPPSDALIAAYMARHLQVEAGGQRCAAEGAPATPAATRGFRRVELRWRCPQAEGLRLSSHAFFDEVPTHLMHARVEAGERSSDALLSTEHRSVEPAQAPELGRAGMLDHLGLGLMHILTGPDHIAFLLGLVLVSQRWRDLAWVITGFTLGHSVTLALAVTGWLRPQPALIDVLIALTIGLVGAENLARASRRTALVAGATGALLLALAALRLAGIGKPPAAVWFGLALFAPCYLVLANRLCDATGLRAGVTAVFGLVHGFAFANDLIEMRLPPGRLAELLFGFNLGVEAGQLLIVALLLGSVALLRRLRLRLSRGWVVESGSAALVGLAVFWIIGRTAA